MSRTPALPLLVAATLVLAACDRTSGSGGSTAPGNGAVIADLEPLTPQEPEAAAR
jgi:hypothetical protein